MSAGKNVSGFMVLGLTGGLALWLWNTSRGGDQQDDVFKAVKDALDTLGASVKELIPPVTDTKTPTQGVVPKPIPIDFGGGTAPATAQGVVNAVIDALNFGDQGGQAFKVNPVQQTVTQVASTHVPVPGKPGWTVDTATGLYHGPVKF